MMPRRDVFQAIADPTRRAILTLLAVNAMTPGMLAENFDSTRQTVSRHIQVLRECRLVHQEQSGREIFYRVNADKLLEVVDWLQPFIEMWDERFDRLETLMKQFNTGTNDQ